MGKLVFLGTGDPLNGERAQSCLAVPLAGGETLLLDVSGGTIVLQRLAAAGIALGSIRHIFVSHRHFDHAGGLPPLLVALLTSGKSDVVVSALPATLRALRTLLELTIPGIEEWLGGRLRWRSAVAGEAQTINDVVLTPFAVEHGIECAGVRLEQAGRSVVFSADTRPCANLITAAQGAHLLIHEVASLEAKAEHTHFIGHSTARDAGSAARAAQAERLMLTHFPKSTQVRPDVLAAEAAVAYGRAVEVARDLLVTEF